MDVFQTSHSCGQPGTSTRLCLKYILSSRLYWISRAALLAVLLRQYYGDQDQNWFKTHQAGRPVVFEEPHWVDPSRSRAGRFNGRTGKRCLQELWTSRAKKPHKLTLWKSSSSSFVHRKSGLFGFKTPRAAFIGLIVAPPPKLCPGVIQLLWLNWRSASFEGLGLCGLRRRVLQRDLVNLVSCC